jgi:D-alanine transaminase
MSQLVFLDGRIVEVDAANVSVLDRANLFGDGLYEVIRCYSGSLFELGTHVERLLAGAAALGVTHDWTQESLESGARRLQAETGIVEGEMYIQLSRGPAVRTHYFPDSQFPTVFITLSPVRPIPADARTAGTSVITRPDMRHGWCHLKTVNLLSNCLAKEKAHRHGVWEGLMLRGLDTMALPGSVEEYCDAPGELAAVSPGDEFAGWVTEGASANVFVVKDGRIATPPKQNILPGVTRRIALELANEAGYEVKQRRVSAKELLVADEVFLTSTVGEIMPVVNVDGHSVGEGEPGPITGKLAHMYTERVASCAASVQLRG